MNATFPFFSNQSGTAGMGVYHTHPRCRVAQSIAASHRLAGTGENRRECPFCCLLGQFQAYRGGAASGLPGPTDAPAAARRNQSAPASATAYPR